MPLLVAGTYELALECTTNDPLHLSYPLPLTVTVTGSPDLSRKPAAMTGNVRVSEQAQLTPTLSNTGAAPAVIDSLNASSLWSIDASLPLTIDAFGSEDVVVTFSPTSSGAISEATFTDWGVYCREHAARLRATGLKRRCTTINLAVQIEETGTGSLDLSNGGDKTSPTPLLKPPASGTEPGQPSWYHYCRWTNQ